MTWPPLRPAKHDSEPAIRDALSLLTWGATAKVQGHPTTVPGGEVVRPERLGESAAGDEGDDDVGGVPIEVLVSPVVHRGGSWIGVAGGSLDFSEGFAGVEGGHDERWLQHVEMYQTELRPLADRSHPAVRGAPIHALLVMAQQDGFVSPFPDS